LNKYSFNPKTVAVGTYDITLTYTNPVTGCFTSSTQPFVVHSLPEVSFYIDTNYYAFEDSIILTGGKYYPEGNYEAITDIHKIAVGKQLYGDSLWVFIPDRIPKSEWKREIPIKYTFTDTNGCSNSAVSSTSVIDESGFIDSLRHFNNENIYCFYNEPDTIYGSFISSLDTLVGNGYFTATNRC